MRAMKTLGTMTLKDRRPNPYSQEAEKKWEGITGEMASLLRLEG